MASVKAIITMFFLTDIYIKPVSSSTSSESNYINTDDTIMITSALLLQESVLKTGNK